MTYAEKNLLVRIDQIVPEAVLGGTTAELLEYVDQYHAGGSGAVERLLPSLNLSPSDIVLDIGSGLGGPARQVATTCGCRVTGVDITEAYVETAIELTERCGLSDLVRFVHSDIAEFVTEERFDAAFTMHVQMNVEAKREWFAEIAKRLAPGGKLAVWEVCQTSESSMPLPLPWSIDGSDSYLAASNDLRDDILGAGFELIEWVDESAWVNSWFNMVSDIPRGPSLMLLLEDGFSRTLNFAGALADGSLEVWRGAFVLSSA